MKFATGRTRLHFGLLAALLASSGLAGCVDGPSYGSVKTTAYSAGVSGYLRGTTAELNGNDGQAAQAYLSSLAEDPDNIKLRLRSLNLALLSNDVPTALRLARTLPPALAAETLPQLVLLMGNIHDNKLPAAQEQLVRLVKANPDVLQFQAMLVQVKIAAGMPVAQGVAQLTALKINPALEGRRWYQVSRLWLQVGNTAKATAALETANTKEPNAVFTTLMLGNLYERNGAPDKAQKLYASFRQANPSNGFFAAAPARIASGELPPPQMVTLHGDAAATLLDFSLLLWAQGAPLAARQLVNTALWTQTPPVAENGDTVAGDPWLLYYGGIIEEFGGDLVLARARFKLAASIPDLAVAAGLRLATLEYHAGETEEAREMLRQLTESHPQESAVWQTLAEMAQEQGDYQEALDDYSQLEPLLAGAPPAKRAAVLFAKGAMQERLHHNSEAENTLGEALKLDPANAQVLNYLAYMWVDQNRNLPLAKQYLEQAVALAPTDGAIVDSLGWAYFRMGDTAKARVLLERAAELTPDDATVADHLAQLYARQGQRAEAHRQWQRALELIKPGEEDIRQQIEEHMSQPGMAS